MRLERIFLSVGLTAVFSLLLFMIHRPGLEGDSIALVHHAYSIPGCIAEGRWGSCHEAGQYPAYQILPLFLMSVMGVPTQFAIHFLAYLSVVSFGVLLLLTYKILVRKDQASARLGVLMLMGGFGLRYINSSFGEMFAAALIFSTVAAALSSWNFSWVALIAFYAGLTKETASPFVWLFVLSAWSATGKLNWKKAIGLGLVLVSSMIASALFNYFRFGSIINMSYMSETSLFTKSLNLQIEHLATLWISPFGGVFWYWPVLMVTMVLALQILKTGSSQNRRTVGFLFLAFAGLDFVFSHLLIPYGWIAWGSRYMLPWIPAAILLILFVAAERTKWLEWAGKNRNKFVFIGAVISFLTLPQFRVLIRHQWVDIVCEQSSCTSGMGILDCLTNHSGVISLFFPGKWLMEWLGALFFCSLYFYAWTKIISDAESNRHSP